MFLAPAFHLDVLMLNPKTLSLNPTPCAIRGRLKISNRSSMASLSSAKMEGLSLAKGCESAADSGQPAGGAHDS